MKSQALFDHGVVAFQRARPDAPKCYPCPLCLRGFPTPEGLTRDHFPPASQGGKTVVLTCAPCNNFAGSELEADIGPAASIYDFAAGTMSEPASGEFTIDGYNLPANLLAAGEHITVSGVHGEHHPVVDGLMRELRRRSDDGDWDDLEIKLSFGKHSRKDSLAAWLRSAYLAMFAAWGYRYILRSALDPVRQQVRNPRGDALSVFGMTLPAAIEDDPHIVLIDRPKYLSGNLAVLMARHIAFLPGLDGDDLYAKLSKRGGKRGNVRGEKEVPWPRKPRYELDLGSSPSK